MMRLQIAAVLGSFFLLGAPYGVQAQEPGEEQERAEARQRAETEAREEAREEARVHERIVRAQVAGSGAYLGVSLRDVSTEDVSSLGLRDEFGALIEGVSEESPAAAAGLQEGDVIATWNGERVESVAMLSRFVRETPPGRSVSLGVFRGGSQRTIAVELGERSAAARTLAYAIGPEIRERMEELREHLRESRDEMRLSEEELRAMREKMRLSEDEMREAREHMRSVRERTLECMVEVEVDEEGEGGGRRVVIVRGGRGRMGVRLQDLTDQLGDYFGIERGDGALITSVTEDSPAAAAGIKAGDVIVGVGAESVDGPGDVARAVRSAEAGPTEVTVIRDGQRRSFTVTLEEPAEGDCENMLVAPEGGPHSFQWHSDDGEVHVLPHAAVAPHVEAFVLPAVPSAPHVLPHGALAPLAPMVPGEVGSAPAAPAAPLPPARTL
jgi:predicted metalloprotease with PDZ domain